MSLIEKIYDADISCEYHKTENEKKTKRNTGVGRKEINENKKSRKRQVQHYVLYWSAFISTSFLLKHAQLQTFVLSRAL